MRYGMIMAGGAGTRLWPMSRKQRPKQLLPLIHGRSLLELAAQRFDRLVPAERRYICTGEIFRDAIRTSLPQFTDERILGEPQGRDTLNAVGFTAAVLHKLDPDAVFAVLTADHLIEPLDVFQQRLDIGFALAEARPTRFVTFSITPTYAATGYGYVERGDAIAGFEHAFRAKRFVEKPDWSRAAEYVAAGTFGWNSGMFVFSARGFLDALQRFKPDNHRGLTTIAAAWGTPAQTKTLSEIYPQLPKVSVDYAIMEPASRDPDFEVATVPMPVSWMDVGSWVSYAETLSADDAGNRSNLPPAQAVHLDSREVIAISENPQHTIATIGCENLIIIHTADATLICRTDLAEKVKDITTRVPERLQ